MSTILADPHMKTSLIFHGDHSEVLIVNPCSSWVVSRYRINIGTDMNISDVENLDMTNICRLTSIVNIANQGQVYFVGYMRFLSVTDRLNNNQTWFIYSNLFILRMHHTIVYAIQ